MAAELLDRPISGGWITPVTSAAPTAIVAVTATAAADFKAAELARNLAGPAQGAEQPAGPSARVAGAKDALQQPGRRECRQRRCEGGQVGPALPNAVAEVATLLAAAQMGAQPSAAQHPAIVGRERLPYRFTGHLAPFGHLLQRDSRLVNGLSRDCGRGPEHGANLRHSPSR